MSLIYIDKVTENRDAFEKKVVSICAALGIDPNWLMAVMWIECGLNHRARNSASGATGLIQFLPSTAAELGTSTTALYNMPNLQQLDYVQKYLKRYASKIKSFTDCYFAVFFPAAIGQYADWVLKSYGLSAAYVAKQNPAYDLNKDNQIKYREVESRVLWMVEGKYHDVLKSSTIPVHSNWTLARGLGLTLGVLLVVFGGFKLYKILK